MDISLNRKWLKLQSPEDQVVIAKARKAATRARNRRANELYAERHPDRVKARRKRWESKNVVSRREYNRQWRAANPDRYAQSMDRWRQVPKNRMKSIIRSRIADAKRRGIIVDEVALFEFIENPPTHCAISGLLLDYSTGRGRRVGMSPSVDRIDSTLGYVRGNIAIVSHRLNTIKSFGTASEHRMVAEYLEKFL